MKPAYQCPDCGNTSFDLRMTCHFEVEFDSHPGQEIRGDTSADLRWDHMSQARCLECDWEGQLYQATKEQP